jgi:hypothetical protein
VYLFLETALMTHVNILISDAPSDSVYMMSGMLIAMLLVAVIIVLLAVTIRSLKLVLSSAFSAPFNLACVWETTLHFLDGSDRD